MCKAKNLCLVAFLVVLMFLQSSCTVDIDGKYDGFCSGFNYVYGGGGYTPIECAARSDKTEFNIEDVTLDFYIGWDKEQPLSFGNDYENSWIVLYFSEVQRDNIMHITNEIDYRDVDDLVYLENIPADEFSSDKYAISITKKSGKIFVESMKFTVPIDMFNEKTYAFLFLVTYVTLTEEGTYSGSVQALMEIQFEYIDDNTIRLNQSYHK